MIYDDLTAGTHAPAAQPPGLSRWGRIHHDLTGIGHALLNMAPVLERIATSPLVDELVEAALQADGLGVEASAFQAAIDALNGASARRQQAAPATASGPQPVIAATVTDDGTAIQPAMADVFTPNGTA